MEVKNNILLIIILLLLSCKGKKEKEIESKTKTESVVKTTTTSELIIDYSKSAKLFAVEVLKENLRVHKFLPSTKRPYHLEILQMKGLQNITAYSNKKYPENRDPSHYEHFVLFTATYDNSETAKSKFDQIKSDSNYGWTDLENLTGGIKDRVRTLATYAKYGGMIIQKENYIFSLVETCGETPIGGKWTEYENDLIGYLTQNGDEIEVLNANCGQDRYQLERRKASTQQNL